MTAIDKHSVPFSDQEEASLDPIDWDAFAASAHAALDDAIAFLRTVDERPVWQPVAAETQKSLDEPLPFEGKPFRDVYAEFKERIFPYATGNIHPRFFGWVHGAGLAGGIVAEMLAAAMNSNCGGRDHGAIYVEKVVDWCKELFAFPASASGLLVSGTSMANLIALGVARNALIETNIRHDGLRRHPRDLVVYASSEVHESLSKGVEILGLGSGSLRRIPVGADFRIRVDVLRNAIAEDRRAGLEPFCVVGTAGTVNTGAIDPLAELASVCQAEKIWFHVDGAFGALGVMSDALRPRLRGLELADSLAFDFHKWAQVQYDAGCVLVRRGDLHLAAYRSCPAYLQAAHRGLAGGAPWPCDFGPELSRGFRALKIWFALKEHGTRRIGRVIERNCNQASYLAQRVSSEPELELIAPVSLNIVCFRFKGIGLDESQLDALNEEIVEDLHLAGKVAPSTTRLNSQLAIRANFTNHRTRRADCDILVDSVLSAGRARTAR